MKTYQTTVTHIAKKAGRTPGRIRQICNENGIGKLIFGKLRVLSAADEKKVFKILSQDRRKKNKTTVDASLSRR